MEQASLPTELILSSPRQSLGCVDLDWMPQPGNELVHQGQLYRVLERRHRYQFKANRYQLYKIALFVQAAAMPDEKSWIGDRWVIGDATCRYNAHSEILRCAIRPYGPCQGCPDYAPTAD